MKKGLRIFLILILVMISSYFFLYEEGITGAIVGVGGTEKAEIEEKVLEELEGGREVSVIVLLEEDKETSSKDLEKKTEAIKDNQEEVLKELNLEDMKGFLGIFDEEKEFEIRHKYSTINAFSGEVTEEGLKKLMEDPRVKKIEANHPISIFLDKSVPQINGNSVANLSVNGVEIKGKERTVCVIDTGVDYNHANLGGGWGEAVIGGYRSLNGGVDQQDCSINNAACFDDHGHGTHVAGIIASNHPTYQGVAPEAKLVVVKAMDSLGGGTYFDVIAGIDWCVNNSDIYNISVISMSLGEEGIAYNDTYCDNNYSSLSDAINSAVGANILVAISSGNCKGVSCTAGISVPACIENAIPVGAVNDGNTIGLQRGDILNLLAPGGSPITSLNDGGGTTPMSGTSMSTPHVAGAVVLLQQFNRLQKNQALTPQEIENILDVTGKLVEDFSSGLNFSRIDVYAAIISIDDVAPTITFTVPTPENGSIKAGYQVIINITSSETLQNATLEWNGTNETMDGSGVSFYKIKDSLINGNYTFRIYGTDFANNNNVTELRTFTFNSSPDITYNFPLDNSYHNSAFNLNISITSPLLSYSDYTIKNLPKDEIQSNSVENINSSVFKWEDLVNISNSSFTDGEYTLSVEAKDSLGNSREEEINFVVDKTEPVISAVDRTPAVVYSDSLVIFHINMTDANRDNLGFLIEGDWTGSFVNYTMSPEEGDRFNYSAALGNFSNQETVSYKFYAFDLAGNMGASSLFNFTVQNSLPDVNITSPVDGTEVEIMSSVQFNGEAIDPDGDNLSYAWDFGDGTIISEQNPAHLFSSTGSFMVALNVSDGHGFSLANITIISNDTQPPEEQSISFNDGMYAEGTVNQIVEAVFFDYSGIFNVTLYFEDSIKEGSCTKSSTFWDCSWSWEINSYGDYDFIIEAADDFGVKHVQDYTYAFSVVGCGDEAINGDEECDTDNLDGETCASKGYDDGTLACSGSCTFDTGGCSDDVESSDAGGDTSSSGGSGGASSTAICSAGAIKCVSLTGYQECLDNAWSGTKDVSTGYECEFGSLVKLAEEIEEEIIIVDEEEEEIISDSEEIVSLSSDGEELKEVTGTSLTGRAISFLEGAGEWNVKGKVFLIIGFLIIVLLIFYFVSRERE